VVDAEYRPADTDFVWVYNNTERRILAVVLIHLLMHLIGEFLGLANEMYTFQLPALVLMATGRVSRSSVAPKGSQTRERSESVWSRSCQKLSPYRDLQVLGEDMGSDTNTGSGTVLADLEVTRALAIQLTAVGTLGLVISWTVFSAIFQLGTGQPATFRFAPGGVTWWTAALNVIVILVLGTAFVVPHEWLHGLAIRHYGGEPRYGVGIIHFILPYAYATTDHEFSRNQFIVVLLTPLVVLTLLGVPLMLVLEWGWLIVPLATNAAGAIVDLWMAVTMLGYPSHVRVQDHEAGVRIVGREDDRGPGGLSVTALVWDSLSGAAVAAFGVLVLLAIAGPLVLSALGVDSLTIGTPGTPTYLFSFVNTPEEISFGVGPGVLGLGALVGVAYAFVRSYRRGRGLSDDGPSEVSRT